MAEQDRQQRGAWLDGTVVPLLRSKRCANSSQLRPSRFPGCKQYFTWIAAGNFRAGFDLQVDQLTVVMLLVVTGVGWLIHIYSTGYMAHEGGYYRFFSYLNLFMFFMLMLVLAANYVLLFVGWEGVGLCSYLLIGFYFLKKSATDAGKKAFIVNRIGDFGFMLGMFLLFRTFGTLDFTTVFAKAAPMPADAMGQFGTFTVACLLLFMGATGKSAQLPLYVWLPDAMEGPTPVSALDSRGDHGDRRRLRRGALARALHACAHGHGRRRDRRLRHRDLSPRPSAWCRPTSRKFWRTPPSASSATCSWPAAWAHFRAGIFHLMTHAFFKALLFLAAGSVIHAMGGEQDMRHMGGLSKKIKWTYATMLMATLAIAGFPPLGRILQQGLHPVERLSERERRPNTGHILYGIGLLTALLTSFYMFRLIFLTFFGKQRYDEHHVHVHESPRSMLVPLVILAVLSVIGGWLAAPAFWGGPDYFTNFLAPVFGSRRNRRSRERSAAHQLELTLAVVAVASALLGLGVAYWLYHQPARKSRRSSRSRCKRRLHDSAATNITWTNFTPPRSSSRCCGFRRTCSGRSSMCGTSTAR